MRLGRWPWALFAVVSVPLAAKSDIEGILYVALPLAALADVSVPYRCRTRRVLAAFILANALGVIAAIRPMIQAGRSHIIAFADDTFLGFVLTSRTLSFITTMLLVSRSSDATVIRTYVYVVLMFVAQVLAVLQLEELGGLVRVYGSVDATTRAPCAGNSTSVAGYVFPDKPFTASCPTQYWEEVRTNFLFASQLYALYTLTTDLPYDFSHDNTEYARSRVYVLGSLAVVECIAACAAVAVQFDTIAGCAQLSWGVGALVLVAVVGHVLRRATGSLQHHSPCEDLLRGRREARGAVVGAGNLFLRNVKLKL
jgi:hypothetical protein